MTHVARYSIVRFLPYAETEEFANVGIVMLAPTARYFDFQLSNKWRRLSAFFDKLDRRVFAQGVAAFSEELARTRDMAVPWLAGGEQRLDGAQRIFDDLVRPREALFRFSSVRAVMTASPAVKLAELFDHYVEHDFATPEYQEKLIEKAVRGAEGVWTRVFTVQSWGWVHCSLQCHLPSSMKGGKLCASSNPCTWPTMTRFASSIMATNG